MKASRTGIIVSAAPGLLSLCLFCSLALHMHGSLGGWPSCIGETGFPPALLTHATIATSYFWTLLIVSLYTLPIIIVICLFVSRWRHLVPYFALYAVVFIVCMLLMQLAPEPYLYWWRD